MRALKPEEMCKASMAGCIARRLAHFHSARIDEDREPKIFKTMLDWYASLGKLTENVASAICVLHPYDAGFFTNAQVIE